MANAVSELWVVPCSGPSLPPCRPFPRSSPAAPGRSNRALLGRRTRGKPRWQRGPERLLLRLGVASSVAPFREANAPVAPVSAVAADLTFSAGPALHRRPYTRRESQVNVDRYRLPEGWYDAFRVPRTPFLDRIGNREGVGFEHRGKRPSASLDEADPGAQSSISGLGRESVARLVTLTGPIGANQPYEEAVRHVRITTEKGPSLYAVLDRVRRSARIG